MIYLQLFLAFLQIGAFSFGGGYAAMPMISAQVVDHYGWLTPADFTDLVTISQMTPGPIAINAATFVGNMVAGIPGALMATLGNVIPSCIFVTFLAYLYMKYKNLVMMQGILNTLRPAVIAMILVAGLGIMLPAFFGSGTTLATMSLSKVNVRMIIYFVIAMVLLRKYKKDPILVMVLTGVMELVVRSALTLIA